jgi:ribosome-binding ATPase YchF (GTP1/OBG family)
MDIIANEMKDYEKVLLDRIRAIRKKFKKFIKLKSVLVITIIDDNTEKVEVLGYKLTESERKLLYVMNNKEKVNKARREYYEKNKEKMRPQIYKTRKERRLGKGK